MEERELIANQRTPEDWQRFAAESESGEVEHLPEDQNPSGDALLHFFAPLLEERITQAMQPLLTEIGSMRRDFETKVKYDESKERVIESLHRELQIHQQGLHFRVLQPVFMDLIALYDDLGKMIEWMEAETIPSPEKVTRHLSILQETVEEILCRQGVETFTREEEVFIPQKQRSVKVIPTSDASLEKHIVRRVRCGFLYDEKLLRYELVDIYKFRPE